MDYCAFHGLSSPNETFAGNDKVHWLQIVPKVRYALQYVVSKPFAS